MLVYRVKHETLKSGTVVWCTVDDAIDEIKMHLLEGAKGDKIIVEITEMSKATYESLPEFEGY